MPEIKFMQIDFEPVCFKKITVLIFLHLQLKSFKNGN